LASLGEAPSVTKLAEWFETLLSVQRSAVGSTEFYMETARALVDLVGLDRGLVLVREGDGWKRVAGHAADPRRGLRYSISIVSLVAEQARTFYGNPQGLSVRTSLANLEAVVASPVLDERGSVVGILYGSRDFTPANWRAEIQPLEAQVVQMLASSVSAGLIRLQVQERLKQVEQLAAVGQAIGYIVHDLRGPLGNAQQLLEMMRESATSTLSRQEQLDFIDASLATCRELLNDSLEFCRGRVRVNLVRGTFTGLLQRHLQLLQMDLDALQVALKIDVPKDLVVVLDPDRMARVFRNLAKNAAEACQGRAGARVIIGGRATAEGIELWVEDNGPGLPPEVQSKMFQPFGTHGKHGGTGFGLAIARQLVEAHEGRISVASDTSGSRFTISLPAAAGQVESSAAAAPRKAECTAPRLRALRILLAEDGVVNQRLAVALLEKWHPSITVTANGREAIAALGVQPFDLVLMDVQMPDMDGLELVKQVRSHHPSIPVILMTAYGSEEIAVQALRSGASNYVPKKNLKQDLGEALGSALGMVEAARQRRHVRGFLVESESRFVVGYEPGGPQALIGYLQEGLTQLNFCDQVGLYQVSTALTEALANAIDHGNLELDSTLRESSDEAYRRLGNERARQPPFRDRRVHVTLRLTPSEAMYVVRDEGPGFDPSTLPDPTDPENLVKPSGRGVMLIGTFMDEVRFNATGNEITMVKRRAEEPWPASQASQSPPSTLPAPQPS
jgi:signal transduction histidine kinase